MSRTEVGRTVEAPVERVFDTIAHIENFAEAIPQITDVEFLTETTRGVGTRFRETREMNNRDVETELEVTEYIENRRIRLVADKGGTIWDTTFTVEPTQGAAGTALRMAMVAKPYKLMAKLTVPLFRRMVEKAIDADMDAVKQYCESG